MEIMTTIFVPSKDKYLRKDMYVESDMNNIGYVKRWIHYNNDHESLEQAKKRIIGIIKHIHIHRTWNILLEVELSND